jgi:hypothetical protein
MSDQKVVVCTVARGGWYPMGAARMIQEFARVSPGYEIQAWVNLLPPGVSDEEFIWQGYDYTGYAAKAAALDYAIEVSRADIAILLDAAFFPIRSIFPLVEHIAQTGYFLCDNGAAAGDWASDDCLKVMGVGRTEARAMVEASSYCVGINRHHRGAMEMLSVWAGYCRSGMVIAGPHTAPGYEGRNVGYVSQDPTVKGHRHDQTALSICAHRAGLHNLIGRPRFTAYRGSETEETVLVNEGMGS